MTDDLVAFLLTRIAEDEQVATAALPGPWRAERRLEPGPPEWPPDVQVLHDLLGHTGAVGSARISEPDAAHIARWDPARVLAECEAKRLLVDVFKDREPTLKYLVLPYREHPEYRVEWALPLDGL